MRHSEHLENLIREMKTVGLPKGMGPTPAEYVLERVVIAIGQLEYEIEDLRALILKITEEKE